MGNKLFFTLLSVFAIGFFGWYTLVFSSFYTNSEIKYLDLSAKNLFLDTPDFSQVNVYFNSTVDISTYSISSSCQVQSQFLFQKDMMYVFQLKVVNKDCKNSNFYLADANKKVLTNTHFQLKLSKDFDLYNAFLDYDDASLIKAKKRILDLKEKYKLFSNVDLKNENRDFVKKSRYFDELEYNKKIIDTILSQRGLKYIVPVKWYQLPEKNLNKLPNGGRPYRASYTNAIHEWWDIDAPLGTPVQSLDAGVIVKVIRNFQFSDLSKLKISPNITYEDRINNLDILRWNQVWLKTMKWDLVFYSHLSQVNDDIQVGNIVPRWYPFGKVGKSWVPDKDYDDYHLHFELRKNPYIFSEAGRYSMYDYMNWDWYFKGKTREYIMQHQYEIFE